MSSLYKYRVWCSVLNQWEYVWLEDGAAVPTVCPSDTEHAIDTEKTSVVEIQGREPVDASGRMITRNASTEEGWGYTEQFYALEVGKYLSAKGRKIDTSPKTLRQDFYELISDVEAKMVKGAEETAEAFQLRIDASAIRSDLIITPQIDIEIVGGSLSQLGPTASDTYIWVEAGPVVLGHAYCKEFIGGKNIRFMGGYEKRNDGRSSKKLLRFLPGLGAIECNEFRLVVRHEVGLKHRLEISLEYFKP